MHPVYANGDVGKIWLSTIFPLYSFLFLFLLFGSFATTNNMSINVFGVDDDKNVIYPHSFQIDMSIC